MTVQKLRKISHGGSLRERLHGYTLAALKALGYPLQSGPDGRGTYRFGTNQAIRLYPSRTIVDYSAVNGQTCYRDIAEFVREHVGDSAHAWVDDFLSKKPEADPFDSDETQPEVAEAAYTTKIEAMWQRAGPIAGTNAEAYLKGRSIELEEWPDNLRYVDSANEAGRPIYGALLTAKTTESGSVAAVQVLFLDGAEKATIDAPRRAYIISRLDLPKSHCGFGPIFKKPPVLVTAEGVEDALSLYQATGLPAVASLGVSNLGRVPECGEVVIFFDQDGKGN